MTKRVNSNITWTSQKTLEQLLLRTLEESGTEMLPIRKTWQPHTKAMVNGSVFSVRGSLKESSFMGITLAPLYRLKPGLLHGMISLKDYFWEQYSRFV